MQLASTATQEQDHFRLLDFVWDRSVKEQGYIVHIYNNGHALITIVDENDDGEEFNNGRTYTAKLENLVLKDEMGG